MIKIILLPVNLKILKLQQHFLLAGNFNNYFLIPTTIKFYIEEKKIYLTILNLNDKNFFQSLIMWVKHSARLYKKKIVMQGLGFKVVLNAIENVLEFKLGFSHIIKVLIPKKDLNIFINKNIISVSSINPVLIGNFLYKLRSLKYPNIYKGKGMVYKNEIFILKEIKKA